MRYIVIDSVCYRVRVVFESLKRSFSIVEGPNGGTSITARTIRDIVGTAYGFEMDVEPDPRYREDYDAFYEAISAPVESHMVELPYGNDTLKSEAMIVSGEDVFGGKMGGRNIWKNLRLQIQPILPQRRQ